MLLSKEDTFKKSLFKKASSSAPLLLLLRVLQRAKFALWSHRTQNSLLLPLQTSSTQRMRVDVSLSWHARPRSHKEWESSWHGRDERRRSTGGHLGPGPCCLDGNPPQEYPGMSRNRLILFVRMSISRWEALQHLSKRGGWSQISARGGWSQEPSRSDAGSPHRTGAASPEQGPPKTHQPGSV